MVAEDGDDWEAEANQHVYQGLHLFRLAVVREVARDNQQVGLITHGRELFLERVSTLRRKM
jgi:hypothetical protein